MKQLSADNTSHNVFIGILIIHILVFAGIPLVCGLWYFHVVSEILSVLLLVGNAIIVWVIIFYLQWRYL